MQKIRTWLFSLIILIVVSGVSGLINFNAHAQDARPPVPAPLYQEPVPVKREIESTGLRRVLGAPESSSVLSNVLPAGDSSIHGLIYDNGFLWASTRTAPGSVLKINPTTLAVDGRATFLTGRNNAEDILAANGYIWSITSTDPAWLVRVDPATMAVQYTSLSSGGSNFLAYAESLDYNFGKLWVGGYNKIAEVDISNPSSPTFILHDYSVLVDQDYALATAMASDSNYIWAVFTQGDFTPPSLLGATFARLDPSTPTSGYITATLTSVLFPDDMFRENGFLYTSSENSGLPSYNYMFPTSMVPYTTSLASGAGISYGTFFNPLDPNTFWGAFTSSPGLLLKFDMSLNKVFTTTLPLTFDDPSEIAFDPNGNMYVTTFQDPAGVVKYTVPSSVTLGISKSGSDAVLGWTNSDALVDHYEVWRSTSPYFQPGDAGSSKLSEVSASVGSLVYTDTGALGDVNNNYFYIVRAFNDFGLLGPISNRVGEFDFGIEPGIGATLKWTYIGMPLQVSAATTADAVASYIDPGGSIKRVGKWNAVTKTWIFRVVGSPFPPANYPVAPGDSLLVYANNLAPSVFAWVGDVPAQGAITYTLTTNNWYSIMPPIDQNLSTILTADALAADIQNGAGTSGMRVGKWDASVQTWIYRIVGSPFPPANYSTRLGYPYFVLTNSSTPPSWP